MGKDSASGNRLIANNKKAYFDYFIEDKLEAGLEPVSYTHLDVYKRQGVDYVIVGHSERRQYFGEDDECINRKVRKAIEYGLTPIICCGETIQQREEGITLDFINKQIDAAFLQVSAKDAMKCVIAYEPIWAIGTGRVATSAQAQEVCEAIRLDIRKLYGEEAACLLYTS